MQLKRIIALNVFLILLIGVYGVFSDEPYFRANGHSPNLYDLFAWVGLTINGPSGFLAERIAYFLTYTLNFSLFYFPANHGHDFESGFLLQYFFWALLLWPQWHTYRLAVKLAAENKKNSTIFHLITFTIFTLGIGCGVQSWLNALASRELNEHINVYYWAAQYSALGFSGAIVEIYRLYIKVKVKKLS